MSVRKILIIKTALKIPFDCTIVSSGKPQFDVTMNDRIYFEDGEVKKIAEEDIYIPEPNICPEKECDEILVDDTCPIHGKPPLGP